MNLKIFTLLLLLTCFGLLAQSQTSAIKGRIVSFKNVPLSGVSVTLQNTSMGGVTNSNGDFRITSVTPGTYTIVATSKGYTALKKNITVVAGKNNTLDLQLSENQQELMDVVVTGRQAVKPW